MQLKQIFEIQKTFDRRMGWNQIREVQDPRRNLGIHEALCNGDS